MIPDPDWSDHAAVKRYNRKVVRRALLRFGLLPILIGLLLPAGFMVYQRSYPEKAEQQRQRVREHIKTNLNSPATKGDLLFVLLLLLAFGMMAMTMLQIR